MVQWAKPRAARPVSGIEVAETVSEILHAHRTGVATPADTVARSFARIRAHGDPAVFISLRDEAAAIAEAKALMATGAERRPLYGIPVAIKDNIDAEGMSTTAACPPSPTSPARIPPPWPSCAAPARSSSARPTSISLRPAGRRALALRHSPQHLRPGDDPRRLEFGLRRRRRRGPRAAVTRHGHGRLGASPRRIEQHRRSQAEPRACFHRGRRSGLPLARLRVDLCVDH